MDKEKDVSVLIGKTIVSIKNNDDIELIFECSDGIKYRMYHEQDCCENVYLIDTINSFDDILNTPILKASKDVTILDSEGNNDDDYSEDKEYTFYNIATINGYVGLRWYGESDYYSTSVSFEEVK